MVRNPAFPDIEVDRERSVILDELAKRAADPAARLTDRLYERAFPGAAYSRSPGGAPSAIKTRGRDTLAAYCSRLYVPGNCILSVAGDVTIDGVMTEATKAFGSWQPGAKPSAVNPSEGEKPVAPGSEVVQITGEQPTVGIAFPVPPASDTAGVCNALVAAALLGGDGLGGRLGTERWAGTHASVLYVPRKGVSLLVITAQVPRPVPPRPFEAVREPAFHSQQELMSAIEAEVLSISSRLSGSREVAGAVRTVQGEIEYDIETCAGMAQAVGRAEAIGQVSPEKMIEFAGKVGPTGLLAFAQKWLVKEREVRAYTAAEVKN
jgi:predicted Zn-dependent peptidase